MFSIHMTIILIGIYFNTVIICLTKFLKLEFYISKLAKLFYCLVIYPVKCLTFKLLPVNRPIQIEQTDELEGEAEDNVVNRQVIIPLINAEEMIQKRQEFLDNIRNANDFRKSKSTVETNVVHDINTTTNRIKTGDTSYGDTNFDDTECGGGRVSLESVDTEKLARLLPPSIETINLIGHGEANLFEDQKQQNDARFLRYPLINSYSANDSYTAAAQPPQSNPINDINININKRNTSQMNILNPTMTEKQKIKLRLRKAKTPCYFNFSSYNFLIANTAFADLIYLSVQPFFAIHMTTKKWKFGEVGCKLISSVDASFHMICPSFICLIALERLLTISSDDIQLGGVFRRKSGSRSSSSRRRERSSSQSFASSFSRGLLNNTTISSRIFQDRSWSFTYVATIILWILNFISMYKIFQNAKLVDSSHYIYNEKIDKKDCHYSVFQNTLKETFPSFSNVSQFELKSFIYEYFVEEKKLIPSLRNNDRYQFDNSVKTKFLADNYSNFTAYYKTKIADEKEIKLLTNILVARNLDKINILLVISLSFGIPVTITIIAYTIIIFKIRYLYKNNKESFSNYAKTTSQQVVKKITKVLVLFISSIGLYHLISLMAIFWTSRFNEFYGKFSFFRFFIHFVVLFAQVNHVMDPSLYAFSSDKFKRAYGLWLKDFLDYDV